jgi:hypothetical protein
LRYVFMLILLFLALPASDFKDVARYTTEQVITAARNYSPTCQVARCG